MIYGEHHVSHNVHGLFRIVDDVHIFGSLDEFSCFKFENYNQKLKRMIRKNEKPLQQIVRRLHKVNQCKSNKPSAYNASKFELIVLDEHNNGPIIIESSNVSQFAKEV